MRKAVERLAQAWVEGARILREKVLDALEIFAMILFVMACIVFCDRIVKRCDATSGPGPTIGGVFKIAGC